MFLSETTLKRPSPEFNALHLDVGEIHLLSLRVSMLKEHTLEDVDGVLHLCSRSLIFQPASFSLPLLKMKFSNRIVLRHFKGVDKNKLKAASADMLTASGAKTSRGPPSERERDLSLNNPMLVRLYPSSNQGSGLTPRSSQRELQSKAMLQEKLIHVAVVSIDKAFSLFRNPISTYITEKNEEDIVFEVAKANSLLTWLKFLKFYESLTTASAAGREEEDVIAELVEQLTEERKKEFIEHRTQRNEKITLLVRARQITISGRIYGFLAILNGRSVVFVHVAHGIGHKPLRFELSSVKFLSKYRYMFRQTALEIWRFGAHRSTLLDFDDTTSRDAVYKFLKDGAEKARDLFLHREEVTRLWTRGLLSNYDYLLYLNASANRSFHDLSSYPVFPWVLSNYTAEELDLEDTSNFRDLSLPVGALNKHRFRRFMDYYEDLKADKTERHAYFYPTHYSTPGFVVYFLVRRVPEFLVKLQNAVFLPTDRVFRSMEQTWYATVNNGPDVKELIPDFYGSDVDFLVNSEKLELGVTNEGETVDNVVLPEWARNPSDFLVKMRAALESNYVSGNIHKWIDLVFGCKQRGDQAVLAQNVFYPLTYEEHVRWGEVRNAYERSALEVQVAEFGQTPVQLFKGPHSTRVVRIFNLDPAIEGSETEHLLAKKLKVATKEIDRLHAEVEKSSNEQMKKINDQMRELRDLELRNVGHVDKAKEEHKGEVRKLQETIKTLEARLREKNFVSFLGAATHSRRWNSKCIKSPLTSMKMSFTRT